MAIITLNNNSLSSVTALPAGVGGKVLQVVHGTDETLRQTTSTSFVSLTLNASITPSSTSSKVFVMVDLNTSTAFVNKHSYFTVYRDSSNLGPTNGFVILRDEVADDTRMAASFSTLDSPSSTSALSYTLYGKCDSSGKARINDDSEGRSTITLMEIGA
jgi:triacylglycerol esterase/lipase EstA (alpha/beta hydrolase family)